MKQEVADVLAVVQLWPVRDRRGHHLDVGQGKADAFMHVVEAGHRAAAEGTAVVNELTPDDPETRWTACPAPAPVAVAVAGSAAVIPVAAFGHPSVPGGSTPGL